MEVVNHGNRNDLAKLVEQVKGVVKDGTTIISKPDLLVSGNSIVINELELGATQDATLSRLINLLPGDIKNIASERGLVVVSDNDVQEVVRRSLIVQLRIRLDYATKTVSGGPWEEEYIPQFTVFTTVMRCSGIKARGDDESINKWVNRDGDGLSEDDRKKLMDEYKSLVDRLKDANNVCAEALGGSKRLVSLFFGGKETIGKGLAKIIEW
jgi:CRISPR-associated protein Cmr4